MSGFSTHPNGRMLRKPAQGNVQLSVAPRLRRASGMPAPPSVPLAPLEGVGTMRRDGHGFLSAPFVRRAFELLEEDPLPADVELRSFKESPDSSRYAAHLVYLQEPSHKVLQIYGFWDEKEGKVRAEDGRFLPLPPMGRYSAVYKGESEARAIFNFKYLNGICVTKGLKTRIAGGARFVARLRSHDPREGKWVILHADIKNAYYGIPVGERLMCASCVRMGPKILKSGVLCMGWNESCGICQALTWGVIGYKSRKQQDLGFPQHWEDSDEIPAVVDLINGGWVVVVIDSIFMMLPQRTMPAWGKEQEMSFGAAWLQRIKTNFEHVRWKLKYATLENEVAEVVYGGVKVVSEVDMVKWGLDDNTLAVWKVLASSPLLNSPRTFFQLVGFLRFVASVLAWPRYILGRLTKVQSQMGLVSEWDAEVVAPEYVARACDMILKIENGLLIDRRSHYVKRLRGYTFFAAVDATEYRWNVFLMIDGKVADMRFGEFSVQTSIDEAESFAMKAAIVWALHSDAACAVIANDNQVVGYDYNAGYARANAIDEHIVSSGYVDNGLMLIIADVPGVENVADVGTRPEKYYVAGRDEKTLPIKEELVKDVEMRTSATWNALQEAVLFHMNKAENYKLRTCRVQEEECVQEPPDSEKEDE